LTKYRPVEDVRRMMDKYGVDRAVLVQHMGEYDNTYIERIAASQPQRFAGVFLIDTDAPDARQTLSRWTEKNVFQGIRLLARTLATRADIWDRASQAGLNIVVYEEPTVAGHVDQLARFLEAHAQTRVVLAHFGRLDPDEGPAFPSFDRVLTLAAFANAFLQISGMDAFARYPYKELVPVVERGLEAFGPQRVLYGTNYPACRSEAAYGADLALVLAGRLGVPADCLDQVVCGTAMELWFDT